MGFNSDLSLALALYLYRWYEISSFFQQRMSEMVRLHLMLLMLWLGVQSY